MANKAFSIALLLMFSTAAFSQIRLGKNGLQRDVKLHANGKLKSLGFYKNGLKNGKWIEYYDNGTKSNEKFYNNEGIATGKWTYWYKNGEKWSAASYKQGELDGQWTYWYKNGKKWHQLSYSEGEVLGKWTFWLESGKVNDRGTYADTAQKG